MAIRKQTRVLFKLSNGQECVVNEHGLARIPGIRDVPSTNIEDELAQITEARLESANAGTKTSLRTVTRAELESLISAQPVAAADAHDE